MAASPSRTPGPDEEAFWSGVRGEYDLPDVIQWENGAWGMMSRSVREAYVRKLTDVNTAGAFYTRRGFVTDAEAVRARVAATLGVDPDEIVFTRNASEALQALISGYNRLRAGDAVLFADLDYDSMQTAMRWLKARRGAEAVEIALPEPATHQGLIDAYEAALQANPRIRLMLLTHVSHRTGLVLPVRDIAALARARGVDVILDSAHALGQVEFQLAELGIDFAGFNLHKWIGAPLGVGLIYIRRARIGDIDPYLGEPDAESPTIDARIHTGTTNFAALLTVPDALDFHESLGPARKAARLAQLRGLWTEAVRGVPGITVLTPADPRLAAGIGAFRLTGQTSLEANRALAKRLLDEFRIFTVHRGGAASGACVRATPGVFSSAEEARTLAAAIETLARG